MHANKREGNLNRRQRRLGRGEKKNRTYRAYGSYRTYRKIGMGGRGKISGNLIEGQGEITNYELRVKKKGKKKTHTQMEEVGK